MKKANPEEEYMKKALLLARKAFALGESPVGCVIVHDGKIIARACNLRQNRQDVTMHAEMSAIRKACRSKSSWRLSDCDLYVTLEPCYMCAGAIIQARIRHVYFGATDPKAGAVVSVDRLFDLPHNHTVQYTGGILREPCSAILKDFFREIRMQKKSLPE